MVSEPIIDYSDIEKNDKRLLEYLKKLGKLNPDVNKELFVRNISNKNKDIRFYAVKNIGKLKDAEYLDILSNLVSEERDSMVKREAVSSIGRMRNQKAIPILLETLNDPDPKIVLQAIRALLCFREDVLIQNRLKKLSNHSNEIIKDLIIQEFKPKNESKDKLNHVESPNYLKNLVVEGDVREILKYVQDESVHLTFTSPPYYNARDYSIYTSYKEYLSFLTEVFREVHRITKEGRFFILNTSPVIIPRTSRSHSSKRYSIPFDIHPFLIEMGWEFIDDIIWLKPEGSSKNRIGGFIQHNKPLAYKPNLVSEYLMVYRKKTDKLIDWNIKQYPKSIVEDSLVKDDFNTSNVWKIFPGYDKVHSAIFPEELCENIIKLYSYKGDLVFDPFAGSGTFGKSAMKLGRYFFLTEINPEYVERIKEKISNITLNTEKLPKILRINDFKKMRCIDEARD